MRSYLLLALSTFLILQTHSVSHNCDCEYDILGDGICNTECNTKGCNYDAFDCTVRSDSGCLFAPVTEVGTYQKKQTTFDHVIDNKLSCAAKIYKIDIYWGADKLQGMKVIYKDGDKIVKTNWTKKGRDPTKGVDSYFFASNEFIVEVSGYFNHGSVVQLYMITNLGQEIKYGEADGWQFVVPIPKNQYLAAFGGSYQQTLELLKFYVFANPGEVCPCEESDIGDNHCTSICNIAPCRNEEGDCDGPKPYLERITDCKCTDLLYNGVCDEICNTPGCFFDTLDCTIQVDEGCHFGKIGSFGEDGGSKDFNDISELELDCNWKLQTLNFGFAENGNLYTYQAKYENNGETKATAWRKNYPNAPGKYEQIILDADEFIVKFAVWIRTRLFMGIEVVTNKGQSYDLGSDLGERIEVPIPDGSFLAAVSGNREDSIRKLTFWVNVLPNNYCACSTSSLGDKECTPECNSEACNFDGGDCKEDDCSCTKSQLGNGICELECYNEACCFDSGDCGKWIDGCDCPSVLIGNRHCNQECNTEACVFDGGDCSDYPDCECDHESVGNGTCNAECFNAACGYDDGDCGEKIEGCDCPPIWIGNGFCETLCNTEACKFDGKDCEFLPGCNCPNSLIRNNECNVDCFYRECIFDAGDCGPYTPGCPCPNLLLNNNECDEKCNTVECFFDNGSCE